MTFDFGEPDTPTRSGRPPRRRGPLLPTLGILVAIILLFGLFAGFWTDWMWFDAVGFGVVFRTELFTKIAMFVVFGVVFGAVVVANFALARRLRPAYRLSTPDAVILARYQDALEPFRKLLQVGMGVALTLFAGSSAAANWQGWLLFANGPRFGVKDPQFGLDVGFYVFTLPWLQFILGFLFALVVVSALAAMVGHWLYGGLRLQAPSGQRTSSGARVHLSVLAGVFVLLKAVSYWLDRYALATADSTVGKEAFVGLKYTDVNALLPGKTILAVIAVICAVLFFATALSRSWMLPGVGVGLLVLSAVLVGGIYPALVQYFQVRPSEVDKEAPYLREFINNTRAAYDIAGTKVVRYAATTTVNPTQLASDAANIPGIRLLDPAVVSPTFKQLQQIKQYYAFPDTLDIDRYQLNGRTRDAVVAVREIDLANVPAGQRNWINDHTVYTHGFGFVGAYANTVDADGKPAFFESNIPPSGPLGKFQPRIYFGEMSPDYSIVGAPAGVAPQELDYPNDSLPSGQQNNTYAGTGGVPMGSFWDRLLFATRFQESNILLSNRINKDSKILIYRDPRTRVEKVAPWLTLDGDPYPAVVNGRIVWILDGYTTTSSYPYSERTTLQSATTDAITAESTAVTAQPPTQVNYIRNSVKATVDAYNGTVTLYAWDPSDPVLQAWMDAFPGTVKPRADISPQLMAHLRYPEDLFKVQRSLLAQFHVTDPTAFYSGQDFWKVPTDPTNPKAGVDQPPYYLTLQMPGAAGPTFSLTSTYIPRGQRANLTAFLAVNANPGPGYGTLQLLQMPSDTTIPGPPQVQNNFESNPDVSRTLSLLRQGGSDVVLGNLLTIPVGGGLLYVEPVYVQASNSSTSYPLLQKVLVAFGDKIGFDNTLPLALAQVFGPSGAIGAGGTGGTTSPPSTSTPTPSPGGTPTASSSLAKALADAQQAIKDASAALKAGDWAAYGAAQQRLQEAIAAAVAAQKTSGATPTPTPGTTATPTPASPSPTPAASG